MGGLAALALGILSAAPASARDDCDRDYRRGRDYDSRYYGDRYSSRNYGDRWHRDFRYGSRSNYGDYGYGSQYDSRYDSYGRDCDCHRERRRCSHGRDYYRDRRW